MAIVARTVVVSMLASLGLGITLGLVFVLFGQVQSEGGPTLSHVVVAALLFAAVTVPLGLIGGSLAGILLRRQRWPASIWVWLIRGVGLGSMVGALGAAVVPVLLLGASRSPAAGSILAMFSFVGAVGGILTGAVVAVWCYRAQQSMLQMATGQPTAR